jgi:hypothetical protein
MHRVPTSSGDEAEFNALLAFFHDVMELKDHFLPKRKAQVESNGLSSRLQSSQGSGTSSAAARASSLTTPQVETSLHYAVAAADALVELWTAERATAVRSNWGPGAGTSSALDQPVQAVADAVAAIARIQHGSSTEQLAVVVQALSATQRLQDALGGRHRQPVMLALAKHLRELLGLVAEQLATGIDTGSVEVRSASGGRGRGRSNRPSGGAPAGGGRGGVSRPGRGNSGSTPAPGTAAAGAGNGGAGVMQLLGRTALQSLGRLSSMTNGSSSRLQLLRAMRAAIGTLAELTDATGVVADGLLSSIVPTELLQVFQGDVGGVIEMIPALLSALGV